MHIIIFLRALFVVSSGTFSIGIPYNYTDKKDPLYTTSKYSDLESEILEYKHIDMEQYETEILPKALYYVKTKLVRSYEMRGFLGERAPMNEENLMTIIMYCDYTELSRDFTSTFRKKNAFEPVETSIKRHTKYCWFARILKETIADHGHSYWSTTTLSGPFFCGMSFVMDMPQFNISLLSPTSTSRQIAVAVKFGGHQGIVIEFNNDKGQGTFAKGLDVSWISRFTEEDGRYNTRLCSCIFTIHCIFPCTEYTQIIFWKPKSFEYNIHQNI